MNPTSFLDDRIDFLGERYRDSVTEGNYFYETELTGQTAATVDAEGTDSIMLSSYSYLGLLRHPTIDSAAHAALEHYGTGTHGVRLLSGTTTVHRLLEERIAAFKGTEAAVVFSTGYTTNVAAVSTLMSRHSVVICDKLNHASIVDACRLSGAEFLRYAHNDLEDLRRALVQAGDRPALVVVDGVFSMDGDIVPLPETVALAREFGAAVMVDEAHSLGVLGATGHGVEEHFGLDPSAVDVKMGSLSKAIPASGGYIAGSRGLIDALKHNARPYIFSSALPPAVAAAAAAAFDVIEAEPERVTDLQRKAVWFRNTLRDAGFRTGDSSTPILPLLCGTDALTFEMTRLCRKNGVYVTPVVFPAVQKTVPRLRLVVTSALDDAALRRGVDVLIDAGRATGLIGR
ncbi:aminotransferase class I/II-fold pyridoxal phosphate-dependent enzyme [Actinophytocola oryzae]|uniref:8-amino-7-oxononanoate synthase n=1 Tax=Actinophytocola oryzae TaxID=502181 RepID=A0A4R7W2S7_9PSEU|nr:pyridoxal phosphate-dependent aminotransferase family protein [Actinophytocola oryzae]TDV56189.1 8-amino-7-oxononanoate synthase [Actinophytocola oryzae]